MLDFGLQKVICIQNSDTTLKHHGDDCKNNFIPPEPISQKCLQITIIAVGARAFLVIYLLLRKFSCLRSSVVLLFIHSGVTICGHYAILQKRNEEIAVVGKHQDNLPSEVNILIFQGHIYGSSNRTEQAVAHGFYWNWIQLLMALEVPY